MKKPQGGDTRRWVLDGLEEDSARVEEDGGRVINVPRWFLPAEAREGEVLRVTRTLAAGSATVTISTDPEATSAALAASRAQVERIAAASRARDPGGDVSL